MQADSSIRDLLNRFPEPDEHGRYVNLDQGDKLARINEVVAALIRGGRDSVLGLIASLDDPTDGCDVKARYVLHLMAVHVTKPGNEPAPAEFVLAVASQVGGGRPKNVQVCLIERLQLAGTSAVCGVLGQALLDPELCGPAARALASIREGAVAPLLAALSKVEGRQRLAVLQNLAVLQAGEAANAFRQALADGDPDIRITAAWGLARVGDASDAETLLKCADAHEGWERFNETDACLTLAERLAARGNASAAAAIRAHLQRTRTAPSERHVRAAAGRLE
jgi:HEAT repeat protein